MSEHTPIPWSISKRGVACICANTPNSNIIVNCGGWGNNTHEIIPEQEANAALIVKAVNSHDALVAALKRVLSIGPMGCYCGLVDSSIQCDTCQANAALKSAGEL